jgi:hypothetical protein
VKPRALTTWRYAVASAFDELAAAVRLPACFVAHGAKVTCNRVSLSLARKQSS